MMALAKCRISLISCVVILTMLLAQIDGYSQGQCPTNKGYLWNRFMKSIEYDSPKYNKELFITDADYDSETGDFFYLGRIGSDYHSEKNFVCRTNVKGEMVWINAFYENPVYKSLQYSPALQTVYHTSQVSQKFTLMRINSNNGTYKESYQVSQVYQHDTFDLCALSDDESALFCVGKKTNNPSTAVIRFDTVSEEIHLVYYPQKYTNSRHLDVTAINGYEVFFQTCSDYNSNHLIKGTFNFTGNVFKEDYHQSLKTRSGSDAVKVAVDEKGETIWSAIEVSDRYVMYQQNNISDFSLIGNKYLCTDSAYYTTRINRIGIVDETLYIMFFSYYRHLMAKIDTKTQKLIKVYETPSGYLYDHRDLLIKNGYINIFNFRDFKKKKYVHNQISSDIDFLPRYVEKNVIFDKVTNSSFNLKDERLGNYTLVNQKKSIYYKNGRGGKFDITVNKDKSYIISLPESFEQEILVGPNQTLSKDINLPCSLAYSGLNYTILNNNNHKKPYWVNIDYSRLKININTPYVNETTKFSFNVSTQYLDGVLNSTINIIVSPCTTMMDHCQECSNKICTTCEHGYFLSLNSKSCILDKDNITLPYEMKKEENVTEELPEDLSKIMKDLEKELKELDLEEVNQSNNVTYEFRNSTENVTQAEGHTFTNTTSKTSYETVTYYTPISKTHAHYKMIKPIVQLALGLGILIGFFNGFLFAKPYLQDAWVIIHQMQMILLLTLINGYIPYYVEKLILQCSFSALSLFLFPVKVLKSVPLLKVLYPLEPDQALLDFGVTTGSTILSCIFLLFLLLVLIMIHLFILCVCKENSCKTLKKYIPKAYPRIFIETFIFVMIASMFEFKIFYEYDENGAKISIVLTCFILFCETMFLFLVLVSCARYSKVQEIDEDSFCSEFYAGIMTVPKQNQGNDFDENTEVPYQVKMARLYTSVFLLRRLLMVIILVFISESYNSFKIWSFISLQVAYILYLVKFRCFERMKDKIYEIANEVMLLGFMVTFFVIQSRFENIDMEASLLNAILFQSLFLLAGSLSTPITALIRKCRRSQSDQVDAGIHNFSAVKSTCSDEGASIEDESTLENAEVSEISGMNKNQLSNNEEIAKEEQTLGESGATKSDFA